MLNSACHGVSKVMHAMSEAELLALPSAVDLTTAGRAFGIGRTKAYELARAGEFPCKVIPVGPKFRVPRKAIWAALDIEPPAAGRIPAPPPDLPRTSPSSLFPRGDSRAPFAPQPQA